MKLNVILTLMNIYKTARMMGDYNSSKSVLYTKKLTGNHIGCMGFANYGGYYNPNTLLNEDIRSVTQKPQENIHQQNQQLSQNLCSKSQDQNKAAQPFI